MQHYIIGKFNDSVTNKAAVIEEITKLYTGAEAVSGIHSVKVLPNVTPRPNRYDVMIILDMEAEALNAWDACEVHHIWKENYGPMLEKKCIFDA